MSIWHLPPKAPQHRGHGHSWSLVEAVVIAIGVWAAAMVGIAETGLLPH